MAISDYLRFGLSGLIENDQGVFSEFTGYDPEVYGTGGTGTPPRPGGGPIGQYSLTGPINPYAQASGLGIMDPQYYGEIDPYEYLYEKGWSGIDPTVDYLNRYDDAITYGGGPESIYEEDIDASREGWLSTGIMPHPEFSIPESLAQEEEDIQSADVLAQTIRETRIGGAETTMESQIAGLGGLGQFGEAGTEDYEVFGGGTGRAGELQSAYEQQLLQSSQQRGEAITTMREQEEDLQEAQKDIQAKQRQGLAPIAEAGGLSAVDTGYGARIERQQRQLERGEVTVEEELEDVQAEYKRQEEQYEAELEGIVDVESAATSDFELNLQNLGFVQDDSGDWSLAEEGEEAIGTDLSGYRTVYNDLLDNENVEYQAKTDDLNRLYREALNEGDIAEAYNIEKTGDDLRAAHDQYKQDLDANIQNLQEGAEGRISFEEPGDEGRAVSWEQFEENRLAEQEAEEARAQRIANDPWGCDPESSDYESCTLMYNPERVGIVGGEGDPWGDI